MEIAPRRAHLISKQAGAAYPLVEFSKILTQNGYIVDHYCYEHSVSIFENEQLKFHKINSFQGYQKLAKNLPHVIFTGTSTEQDDDSQYWSYANQNKIYSIAWVDQPINLEARFNLSSLTKNLPGIVLANNETTHSLLSKLKLKTKIFCLGSPYLDVIIKKLQRKYISKGLVIFATEPFFEDNEVLLERKEHKFRIENGFDDIDSLLCANKIVEELQKSIPHVSWQLQIKLHPRDSKDRILKALQKQGLSENAVKFTQDNKEKIFETAHVITGARSMFLYEAASLGIPTISLQPQRKSPSPLIDATPAILLIEKDEFDLKTIQERILNPTKRASSSFQKAEFLALLQRGILESSKGIT